MHSPEYSLTDTLERIYENQLALEAALMELDAARRMPRPCRGRR